VPAILEALRPYRDEVRPLLQEAAEKPRPADATPEAVRLWRQHRARAALALLAEDAGQVGPLSERLLEEGLEPAEMLLVRDALKPHAADLKDDLWRRASEGSPARRFRALVALAAYDPGSPRWQKAAAGAVGEMLLANPLHLGQWVEALRPVRRHLLPALRRVFRGEEKALAEYRQTAASVLADYAADRPELLAELLLEADSKQYAVLLPVYQRHQERAAVQMRRELATLPDYWKDASLDPAWKEPGAELRREVEQAGGLFTDRFALCQTLPLARLEAVTEGLRPAGYRPVRVRPWPSRSTGSLPVAEGAGKLPAPRQLVAVVWRRDGLDWKLQTGLTAAQVKANQAGLVPADVAGYPTKAGDRYALLWDRGEHAVVYAGVPEAEYGTRSDALKKAGYLPATVQSFRAADGGVRYSGVWQRGPGKADSPDLRFGDDAFSYSDLVLAGERLLLDVSIAEAGPNPLRARLEADLARARAAAHDNPRDANPRFSEGVALFPLGRDREALAAFGAYLEGGGQLPVRGFRAVLYARAGQADRARRELATFGPLARPAGLVPRWRALVDVYLGKTAGLKALDEAVAARASDGELAFQAACVQARAAAVATARQAAWAAGLLAAPGSLPALALPPRAGQATTHAERALELLRLAIGRGYRDLAVLATEPDLEAVRGTAGFREVLRQAGASSQAATPGRYSSAWRDDSKRQAVGLYGLSAEAHLRRCRDLAAQGWRPAGLSLAQLPAEKGPLAASVWHRPVLPAAEQERRGGRRRRR
jgi:hypothetical protein